RIDRAVPQVLERDLRERVERTARILQGLDGVVYRRLQTVKVKDETRVADRNDVGRSQLEVVRFGARRREVGNADRRTAQPLSDERERIERCGDGDLAVRGRGSTRARGRKAEANDANSRSALRMNVTPAGYV